VEAEISKLFGQIIRRLRTDAGFSQEAFAFHCRIDRTYMGDIERGTTQLSIQMAYRLARGLKVSLATLFLQLDKEIKAERKRQREARKAEKEAKATASASDTQPETSAEALPKPARKRRSPATTKPKQ
jgi:transcriptional regulator with XRE-family HTH domain